MRTRAIGCGIWLALIGMALGLAVVFVGAWSVMNHGDKIKAHAEAPQAIVSPLPPANIHGHIAVVLYVDLMNQVFDVNTRHLPPQYRLDLDATDRNDLTQDDLLTCHAVIARMANEWARPYMALAWSDNLGRPHYDQYAAEEGDDETNVLTDLCGPQ